MNNVDSQVNIPKRKKMFLYVFFFSSPYHFNDKIPNSCDIVVNMGRRTNKSTINLELLIEKTIVNDENLVVPTIKKRKLTENLAKLTQIDEENNLSTSVQDAG